MASAIGATAGTWGAAPAGEIVIPAVLFDSAVPVVSQNGDALAGKIIVDITNPFNPSVTGLAVPDDTSIAQMVAGARPPEAPMSSRRSTPSSAVSWLRAAGWMCSWPAMTRRRKRAGRRSSRASDCARRTPAT
jgi:hypothetical protein